MNNFTQAHMLSYVERLLSLRVGLEAARDASMACKRSSTSSAARSPSEEFVKDTSEASTDCRRPNTFANSDESPAKTSDTEPLLTSPTEARRLSSTGEPDVARDA